MELLEAPGDDPSRPMLGAWLLQIALFYGWNREPSNPRRRNRSLLADEDFLDMTGLNWVADSCREDEFSAPRKCRELLMRRLDALQKIKVPELPFQTNIRLLGEIVNLSATERFVLEFLSAMELYPAFRSPISTRNQKATTADLNRLIAHLAGVPEKEIQIILSPTGTLQQTGILKIENGICDLECKSSLFSGLTGVLLTPNLSREDLTGSFLRKASAGSLAMSDYPHLDDDIQLVCGYLRSVMRGRVKGANLIFVGGAGLGKTEMVKILAREIGAELYEVAYTDSEGVPLRSEERMRAYALSQAMLVHSPNVMLLFDEIEDVLGSPDSDFLASLFGGKKSGISKAWVNRALETSNVPTIWVGNSAPSDPAYLRRFSYSILFKSAPAEVRLEIARKRFLRFNPPESWLHRVSMDEEISPAQLDVAANVAELMGATGADATRIIDTVLDRSSALLGQRRSANRIGFLQ
jgi:hypothetical protein